MPTPDVSTLSVRMRDWQFGPVWFNLLPDDGYAQTVFPDGSICRARRQDGEDETWWWHDWCHSFLAYRMGCRPSRTLHDVANGRLDQPHHYAEEAMVIAFECYLREPGRGDLDELLPLCEWGRLHEIRREALAMINATI